MLGWIYAANVKRYPLARGRASTPSPWMGLAHALTRRIEQDITSRSVEQQVNADAVQLNRTLFRLNKQAHEMNVQLNGAEQLNGSGQADGVQLNKGTMKLSKGDALDQVLDIFVENPQISYEQVADLIGRSKSTVSN